MWQKTFNIVIIIMTLIWGLAPVTFAQDTPETLAQGMARMINEARLNPAAAAERLGLNVAQLMIDYPDLADIMTNGLPELTWNDRLSVAAEDHVADMVEHGYYSQVSRDGRTCEHRIMEKGYLPAACGESLGLIQFQNFIKPEKALKIILDNMFIEQFQLEPNARTILNPQYQEIGTAESAGILEQEGRSGNAYFVNCLFGTEMSRMDSELFHLINQARVKPLVVAKSLGFNRDEILARLPELHDILINGLPPLTINHRLNASAFRRTAERAENGYFSPETDYRPLVEQLTDFGYQAQTAAEQKEIVYYFGQADTNKENQAVEQFLKKLLQAELTNTDKPKLILNPDYQEIGLRIHQSQRDSMFPFNRALIAVIQVAGVESKLIGVAGNAFIHNAPSGLYGPGQGLADLTVYAYQDGSAVNRALTSASGSFNLFLLPGEYVLTASYQDQIILQNIMINAASQSLYLPFYLIEEEI